jgi:mono/diheme cytochrome c family protein
MRAHNPKPGTLNPKLGAILVFFAALIPAALPASDEVSVAKHYAEHCASCHGADRFGKMGPALLPRTWAV